MTRELTLQEKLAVQKADRFVIGLQHILGPIKPICGFDKDFQPIVESDSLLDVVKFPKVAFIREKLSDRKRYYRVIEANTEVLR